MQQLATAFLLGVSLIALTSGDVRCEDETRRIELPEKYREIAVAGNGRYIALAMAKSNRAIVYDVTRMKAAFEVGDVADSDLFAGSSDRLLVVSPTKMQIRSFELNSGKLAKTARIPGSEVPLAAECGPSGDGPLLLVGQQYGGFFDLNTLSPMTIDGPTIGGIHRKKRIVQVSADGKLFGTIRDSSSNQEHSLWHIDGNRTVRFKFAPTNHGQRWAQPTANGALVLMPRGEVYSGVANKIEVKSLSGSMLIPTLHPSYFLSVRILEESRKPRAAELDVFATADCRKLIELNNFPELIPEKRRDHHWIDTMRCGQRWRVICVPELKLLVTLPEGNQSIVARPFDIERLISASDPSAMYVKSSPPLSVKRNGNLKYSIDVHSNSGAVTMSLQDGPAGARLRKGTLQWKVPTRWDQPTARFVIEIENEKRAILHSIEILVTD